MFWQLLHLLDTVISAQITTWWPTPRLNLPSAGYNSIKPLTFLYMKYFFSCLNRMLVTVLDAFHFDFATLEKQLQEAKNREGE